jgi:hypothetical protein
MTMIMIMMIGGEMGVVIGERISVVIPLLF